MNGRVLAITALALLFTAAMGQAYPPLFIPLSEHTMAKGVCPNAVPCDRTYSFSVNDEQAVSWILIFRDDNVHTVEWRWYYPEGRTYARTFSVIPPIDGYAGMWAAPLWSCLKIAGTDVAHLPGNWKVDVIVDFRKVLTEYFTISGQGCRDDS
jgi:hypothetical protein